ncbi:MAG: SLC13 family permease [Opitutaceae bacterium]|nr:SLC13 family permease [Opitutaceae bacterium]
MTWEIAFIFFLLIAALVSFALEKIPPDVTALTLFAVLLLSGLLPVEKALSVFSNPAPITIGAMFILSAGLGKCGLIDKMALAMGKLAGLGHLRLLFFMMVAVAVMSAFINNTPVVVVFMPIVLSLAKKLDIAASKLLIPLSYASIFGGMCTLIGTSTNILVSGIAQNAGQEPLRMFEFAKVGFPILVVGILYILLFGRKLLPVRETLTAILSEEERREYITEAFVEKDSSIAGKTLAGANILKKKGIRVIEIIRFGVVLQNDLNSIVLKEGDRLIMACRPSGIAHAQTLEGVDFVSETGLGLGQIASHEGMLVEGVIGPNSSVTGSTITEINFRQRFRMIVLAVHRRGVNLREKLGTLRLEFGDTLLMLGTDGAINQLRANEDILLIDRPPVPVQSNQRKIPIVLATVAAVVGSASLGFVRIEFAAIVGAIFLFLTGCVRPKDGYASIQWNILFLICAMLGMGIAMQDTGASTYLSSGIVGLVDSFVPPEYKALAMLAAVYIITNILTEILSNNAAAVIMATLVVGIATSLNVDARPFFIAVAIAASASFATPIGYQTNTYVYGVGGYRFSDFIRVGIPLNILCFIVAMITIPYFWSL